MEARTGTETQAKFPLNVRASVFAVAVGATVLAFATYVPPDIGRISPPANILANTWYGPLLVIAVPIALGWFGLGMRRKWSKFLILALAILLLVVGLHWIYLVRLMSGTLPEFIMPDHWVGTGEPH